MTNPHWPDRSGLIVHSAIQGSLSVQGCRLPRALGKAYVEQKRCDFESSTSQDESEDSQTFTGLAGKGSGHDPVSGSFI